MHSLTLHPAANTNAPHDPAGEVARLEALLAERRKELSALRETLHNFKTDYTRQVGSRLAELADVERDIRAAESRLLGHDDASSDDGSDADDNAFAPVTASPVKLTLRKLFWSIAKAFHPDYAADAGEARRRHTIMAEASRAYREGDVESLHTLLGDETLQSYCATAHNAADEEDLGARLIRLKEELRTVEFGLKRLTQDGLYRTMLAADEAHARGRDTLADMAERIQRQIVKARHRLANLV